MDKEKLEKTGFNEMELPETLYIRDIDDRVFQAIVLQTLDAIEGIAICGGNFLDSLLGRTTIESLKGIHVNQENKKHSVSVKVEVGILYGVSIPEKSEEIQSRIAHAITEQTGLHVSCVHVVFRNVFLPHRKNLKEEEIVNEKIEISK